MAPQSWIAETLRLTRQGNLMEATALVRDALGAGARRPQAPAPTPRPRDVIDLVPERVSFGTGRTREDAATARQGGFDALAYHGAGGTLRYHLFRPAKAVAGMPLVVMLHGCTQSPEDFARGTGMNALAEELGFFVAYPQQDTTANPQKCWNWFRPGDQQRDRGEPALLAGVTRAVIAAHDIDPDRVYVAGLSAGGAAAAVMAAEYPDLFAAVGVHSGLPCGAARDVPSALMAMKQGARGAVPSGRAFVPVITFHGDRDTTVAAVNSDEIVRAATQAADVPLRRRVEKGRSPSGRSYARTLHQDPDGITRIEQWTINGAGHAWSGGSTTGTYTDPAGPEASREMLRFFLDHPRR
ncbi:alpha/beta hydrolase family esterase [Sphingomonas sp. CJ20]